MLQIVTLLIAIALLACAKPVEVDEPPSPSESQMAEILRARKWLDQSKLTPIIKTWPYHFGTSPACVSHFTSLMRSRTVEVEGEDVIGLVYEREGIWLVTDLQTGYFWLLTSGGYFGPSHFYGPAYLNLFGDLVPVPDASSAGNCAD